MSETARKLATWEDLAATPDDGRVYEIFDGQIEAQPRPLRPHNRAQAALSGHVVASNARGAIVSPVFPAVGA